VRSKEKGEKILAAHPNTPKEKLSYVIVKDVAQDGAFDEVCTCTLRYDISRYNPVLMNGEHIIGCQI
jgi:hypothetical protein